MRSNLSISETKNGKETFFFMPFNLLFLNILLLSLDPYKDICRQRATKVGQKP
jgi:hypothetical protein